MNSKTKDNFKEKIKLLKEIRKYATNQRVFTDRMVFNFANNTMEVLAERFSTKDLTEALRYLEPNAAILQRKPTESKSQYEVLALLTELQGYAQKGIVHTDRFILDFNQYTYQELAQLYTLNDLKDAQKYAKKMQKNKSKTPVHSVKTEFNSQAFEDEYEEKRTILENIFKIAFKKKIESIDTPFEMNFSFDEPGDFIDIYTTNQLNEALLTVKAISSKRGMTAKEEYEEKLTVLQNIFQIAEDKKINVIEKPFKILFNLDEPEDFIDMYTTNELYEMLVAIKQIPTSKKESYVEVINTLDTSRKYLEGKIYEPELEIPWQSYAPKILKAQIRDLPLKEAYEIVLAKSKEENLNPKLKKEVMDYRFDLEEIIFGGHHQFEQDDTMVEEFLDYPFEEYVRKTVEAIILPHIEVMEKIQAASGKIQFVNIWEEHFSDKLKDQVRKRDQYKCVVCDSEINLHVHHKIPRKLGGVNHPDNLVTLCSSCHAAVETADLDHAYRKCMMNAIKSKTHLQKPVDTSKDIVLLKEEVKNEIDALILKYSFRDEQLASDLLSILKKVDYIFNES